MAYLYIKDKLEGTLAQCGAPSERDDHNKELHCIHIAKTDRGTYWRQALIILHRVCALFMYSMNYDEIALHTKQPEAVKKDKKTVRD